MKKNEWKSTLLMTGLLSGMVVAVPAAASPIEHEIDMTGVAGTTPIAYGDHTINSALATGVDSNSFTFMARAGDIARIAVRGLTNNLDPSLTLRDPVGNIIDTASCGANSFSRCSVLLDHSVSTAGLHTINLSDAGLDNAGSYGLHLERYPPIYNWLGVQYSTGVSESLGHTTDMDFYGFNGVAGTKVGVSVQGLSNDLDSRVEVWDSSGALLASTACSANSFSRCSSFAEIAIATTGVFRVGVSDAGWDNGGNYGFQVSCAFGNCPLPSALAPTAPVPEPATYAMLLAGLGAVGLMAGRRRRTAR